MTSDEVAKALQHRCPPGLEVRTLEADRVWQVFDANGTLVAYLSHERTWRGTYWWSFGGKYFPKTNKYDRYVGVFSYNSIKSQKLLTVLQRGTQYLRAKRRAETLQEECDAMIAKVEDECPYVFESYVTLNPDYYWFAPAIREFVTDDPEANERIHDVVNTMQWILGVTLWKELIQTAYDQLIKEANDEGL